MFVIQIFSCGFCANFFQLDGVFGSIFITVVSLKPITAQIERERSEKTQNSEAATTGELNTIRAENKLM
jgi:hypothetical protein